MQKQLAPSPTRVSKALAREILIKLVPKYLELLKEVKDLQTWRLISERMEEIRKRLRLESYVLLFDDPPRITGAAVAAIIPKEEQAELLEVLKKGQEVEEEFIRALLEGMEENFANDFADYEIESAIKEFEALGASEKLERIKQAQYLFGATFAWLADSLALMVHGESMTQLIRKAKNGNKAAFAKACHIDKTLLLEHPWFKDRYLRAQILQSHNPDEEKLVSAVAYRANKPITQGQTKQAGLMVIFQILDKLNWLDGFTHGEIADICDKIGFGIELSDDGDLTLISPQSITRSLLTYRKYKNFQ
jgi:hypothetical protein